MRAEHLEFMVEEPSMEEFLRQLLPRILPEASTFEVYPHQSKDDLLRKLPSRLQGYAMWLPESWRIVVVVDRDDDKCELLKQRIERSGVGAGLRTRSSHPNETWQVISRIAIEELEAWYFGDWAAVCSAFPRVSKAVPRKAQYRDPDAIRGGTWEMFERLLQQAGYFKGGLRKTEVARALGRQIDPERNTSRSFSAFHNLVLEAVA